MKKKTKNKTDKSVALLKNRIQDSKQKMLLIYQKYVIGDYFYIKYNYFRNRRVPVGYLQKALYIILFFVY